MKIGMILDKELPPDPRVEHEARALISVGYEVTVYCYTREKNFVAEEILMGINVKRFYLSPLVYKLSALAHTFPFYSWLVRKNLKKFLKSNDFDLIHVHDMVISRSVISLLKGKDIPIILDFHENRPEILKHYPFIKKFPMNFLINLSKWKRREEELVKAADGVVLVTKFAVDEMLTRVPSAKGKIINVANHIDRGKFNSIEIDEEVVKQYKDSFTLLYVGDTSTRRGLASILRAIPQIKETIPNIKLVLLGRSQFDGYIFELTKELNISEHVDYIGWVPEEVIPTYVEACDIGISPILQNIHHDTTYANKVFQYIAKWKPVLVSDVLAQKDLIERFEVGEYHKSDDHNDVAQKLIKMHAKRSDRDFYFGRIEEFDKEFSKEHIYSPLYKLYEKLLKKA